jgi:hypothetical protein
MVSDQTVQPTPPPPFAGWTGAATALHAMRQFTRPILLTLTPQDRSPIYVDFRHLTYFWDEPLASFPSSPASVVVVTQQLSEDSPPLAKNATDIDPLLWMIGLNAFPNGPAPWLRRDDKYRLKRWPDDERLPHTAEDWRCVKTLVKSLMTVEKLATLAGVERQRAQSVVNALSLMSAVRRVESATAAPWLPPASATYVPPRALMPQPLPAD